MCKVLLRKYHEDAWKIEKFDEFLGLKPFVDWNIYELVDHPGLIIIQNPFTEQGCFKWIKRCLSEYTGPPNRCNLHNHNLLAAEENWWDICQKDKTRGEVLQKKLRWVTLGYHHNWDTKVYSESEKTPLPEELYQLVYYIGKVIGGWDISGQAAILNFYHMDSTLSGHTDHSEPDSSAPLVSLSFGQSAIFLIGGRTLEDRTSAILINNGDIMVMSGDSRLCYHGIPRIVQSDVTFGDDAFSSFLKQARINLNIRQVLLPGQSYL